MISVKGMAKVVTLDRSDPVFARVRAEAEDAVRSEPDIAGFMFSAILNQRFTGSGDRSQVGCAARSSGLTRRSHRAGLF